MDEKALEAITAALEPKCRSFTGGANPLAKSVAREFAEAALQALSPGSTGSAEGWEDRALAAEAALAGERERCLAIVEAQVPEWVKQRSGPYWDGYREAMEDAADDIRKGALAIRAQGE